MSHVGSGLIDFDFLVGFSAGVIVADQTFVVDVRDFVRRSLVSYIKRYHARSVRGMIILGQTP